MFYTWLRVLSVCGNTDLGNTWTSRTCIACRQSRPRAMRWPEPGGTQVYVTSP
jgi:hypothetical protein